MIIATLAAVRSEPLSRYRRELDGSKAVSIAERVGVSGVELE
jgi:hypothetical protein